MDQWTLLEDNGKKDMEITTCIEVIISIDEWNFRAPSMQWKMP